ncbi:5-OH-xanthotoxin synthase-like [Nicotiana tomentosiformis]|uniref:5-OH-xanthotoxin synthase-like n=1 Tax=Nicotiana tomentosiformis TaxID=4098 RepID=UPI000878CDCF|nr:cytochrome P450 83B1-like [Nicotiana tomentosiformis]
MINHVTELDSMSKLVNLSEIILSLSSSIICRVRFGKRYDEKGDKKRRFHKLLREAEAVLGDFFVSDFFPIFGWFDKVNGKVARLEKIYNELDLFYQELIEEHLSPTRPKSMDGDILDTLILLRDQTLSSSLILTWDHIKAVLMDVFIAGTDTTAAVVVWAMTGLMKQPKQMKKLQENIRELVGKKGRVDEDDIQKLPYLKAVIKETLRLYPPAPLLLPRKTIQKCMVDGYEIQPNTLFFFNAWATGSNPECWKNPEDFIPDRFCSTVTNEDIDIDYKSVEFEMVPFGGGRRGCPGISICI